MTLIQRIGGAALAAVVFVAVLFWVAWPRYDEAEVERTVISTIQREAAAAFYVTGTLEIAVTEEVERTEQLFPTLFALLREAQPSWPGLNRATSRARVRVPGRASYGFDVSRLSAEDIRVRDDGRIEVVLPALSVYATEPRLKRLEVKTEATGWMRLFGSKEDEVERQAVAGVREALRRQAEEHLEQAVQPRVNTARALEHLLRPALMAAGVRDPRFRFEIENRPVEVPKHGEYAEAPLMMSDSLR